MGGPNPNFFTPDTLPDGHSVFWRSQGRVSTRFPSVLPYFPFSSFFGRNRTDYDCISQSYYPDMLKLATIQPILKNGDKYNICNYRPISLLHIINKISETIIYNRIYSFFDDHKLISANQYGFLRGKSTIDANIQLLHNEN